MLQSLDLVRQLTPKPAYSPHIGFVVSALECPLVAHSLLLQRQL
ncbi:MAG: hypothetical protein KatS3mg112_1650 [Thermogutta sp.]|nr:MAG: hypothetical protein KatS3mg112_1650 [Thermogutta sp.]